jgi:DNA-binding transcriptional ArsR family regulator
MNDKPNKKVNIEVASDQLKAELVEIKERLGALETIASLSNRSVVEALARSHLTTPKSRQIMRECEQPQTKSNLVSKLGLASVQALDHHLTPLREADLIHQRFDDDGVLTFEWSKLFKGLPKTKAKELLDVSKATEKSAKSGPRSR